MKIYKPFAAIFLVLLFGVQLTPAQTTEEIYQGFQFHFTAPGARAMAMGGAFLALADDNTAAYYNPAGLVFIKQPNWNAEFKLNSQKTLRAADWNSFSTGELTEYTEDRAIPSFTGFSFPFGNLTAAVFVANTISYYEELNLQARTVPGISTILNPITGVLDVDGYTFGISAALKLNDYWSFGASTGVYLVSLSTTNSLLEINGSDYSDTTGAVLSQTIVDGSDTAMFFSFGFLFTPSESFRLGISYTYYPPMEFSQDLYLDGDSGTGLHYNTILINFDTPDRVAVGMLWKPFERLKLTADGIFTYYAQMTDIIVASSDISSSVNRGDNASSLFEGNNRFEIHAGLEFDIISGDNPFCLRAGFFTLENHYSKYLGTDPSMQYSWNIWNYSDETEDETSFGFSGGFGFALSNAFTVDAAYVITDYYNEGILSLTWKF